VWSGMWGPKTSPAEGKKKEAPGPREKKSFRNSARGKEGFVIGP